MNALPTDHSFHQFSSEQFYTSVNRSLLDLLSFRPGQIVVDLGCGDGKVTRMLLDKADGFAVVAVDQSADRLKEAEANVASAISRVTFSCGSAENLSSVVPAKVDAVVFCNAIHMISDKARVITEISKVLKQGGLFAFNSAFFEGAIPPSSMNFYRRLMLKAVRMLKRDHHITHHRGVTAATREFLTPQGYADLLVANGFAVRQVDVIETQMPFSSVDAILTFEDFITGALPGVPITTASDVLKQAANESFAELGMPSLPRNWLQVVAEKI